VGFLIFDGATEGGAEFIGFELAKGGFAVAFKKLRNGDAGGWLSMRSSRSTKTPSELPSKTRADGCFLAGAHKSGEADDGNAGGAGHEMWGVGFTMMTSALAAFIELSKEYSGGERS